MAESLINAFLHGTIEGADFRHADHVEVAHGLLARGSFAHAAACLSDGLRRKAARAGRPGAYHETVTLAFLAVIAERRGAGGGDDFAAFAAANPDLFDKSILSRWYAPDRLASDLARQTFPLPEPSR